jgi:hypothetical protein
LAGAPVPAAPTFQNNTGAFSSRMFFSRYNHAF